MSLKIQTWKQPKPTEQSLKEDYAGFVNKTTNLAPPSRLNDTQRAAVTKLARD